MNTLTFSLDSDQVLAASLAVRNCTFCRGVGFCRGNGSKRLCHCVWRSAFDKCYAKYRYIQMEPKFLSQARLTATRGHSNNFVFSRPKEEYSADFYLIAKRTIAKRTLTFQHEWDLFQLHFLKGADWKECCRSLKLERGPFFHAVYRLKRRLGEAFVTTKPYGLYPFATYFGTHTKNDQMRFPEMGFSRPYHPPAGFGSPNKPFTVNPGYKKAA